MLVNDKYVPRHKMSFVLCHWLNGISFLMLFITALPLFADQFQFMYDMFGAATLQNAHRFFAVVFIVTPIIGLLIAREGYAKMFNEVFSFGIDDIKFLIRFPLELLGMHPEGVPKQGFYNGGEKMNIALQMGIWCVMVASGLILWFGSGHLDNSVRAWFIPIHSIAAAVGFAAALAHIYLAVVMYPPSLHGMKDGTITAKYAKSHHGKWIDDLIDEEKLSPGELKRALNK